MPTDTDTTTGDENSEHTSGDFLGELEGLRIRGVLDGPVLEIHGDDGMAAVEITSEKFVDGLTEAAATVQMELDQLAAETTEEA